MTIDYQGEVLIVGGGPAGSTCAWKLKQAGIDVAILDKHTFPRDKTCAGWVTPAVADSLDLDLKDYAAQHTLQPLTGFLTGVIGKQPVRTHYNEVVSYGIRRCEFDDYLLRRSDAHLILGESFNSIEANDSGWLINGHIQCRLLIGAGGHFCPIARHLGARPGKGEPAVAAQEVEFAMTPSQADTCRVLASEPELYFCNDLKGYGWVFRKGDFLNIGLGRQDQHRLSSHVEAFIDTLQQLGRIPDDLPKRSGHAYLLYGDAPREILADRVMLIGDSAGLAYPQSGEGIRPAVESALIAADVIINSRTYHAGDYSHAVLQKYSSRMQQRFGPRDQSAKVTAAWLPPKLVHYLGTRLLQSRWFARHFVLNRWFFHQQVPALKL